MKSLLATALALGVAVNGQYYIGTYSVAGSPQGIVPYPLGVCSPNGALSGYNNVIYTCSSGMITEKIYQWNDTDCESTYTTKTFAVVNNPGHAGYSDCLADDEAAYLQVGQYLSNCAAWKEGEEPSATTIISTDGCTYYDWQVIEGTNYSLYSLTECDGEGYETIVYFDNVCEGTVANTVSVPLGCYFYKSVGNLKVYTAWMECYDGEEDERCEEPVADFEAHVVLYNYTLGDEVEELFTDLFWYATVDVFWDFEGANDTIANVSLEIEFCTLWEYEQYESMISDLGATLQATIGVEDEINSGVNEICWSCLNYHNTNKTLYGGFTCNKKEQCWMATTSTKMGTTTTKKSASTVYVSMVSLIGLLLFSLF